ncbi:RecF/RecN/SMC N terminal domain-containing protein [Salinibacterium sp. NYA9b]
MNELSELTLGELASSLRAEANASSGGDSDAWEQLVQIADDLDSSDRDDLLTKNRKWQLRQVSVSGFRGAKHEVTLSIDGLQGVTVLYGENGSGKSSLAEAVRVALEGRTGATHLGDEGSVHELWGANDQRSQGVEEATVSVVLFDEATSDTLSIRASITSSGVERTGLLQRDGEAHELDSRSPAWAVWSDAIRASPPVLAYAELSDELQKKRDLQIWLSSCLAMDNASRVFDSRLKAQIDTAQEAEKAIKTAKQSSTRMVEEVDEAARRQGVDGIQPLTWIEPKTLEELADWLGHHSLVERQKLENHLDASLLKALPVLGKAFRTARVNWSKAATKALLTAQVTDSIVDMNERVIDSGQGDNNETCPTCGTSHIDWREHLKREAERLKEAKESAAELKTLVRRSQHEIVAPLSACLRVLPTEFDSAESAVLSKMLDEATIARQDTDDLNENLLTALHNLSKWSEQPEAHLLIEAALEASGFKHQWRCDRWAAVSPYLSAFKTNINHASKTTVLRKARSKWNKHLAQIRSERSSSLHALVGPAVATLLGDVGISVSAIRINKLESELELQDANGQSVELAHLSAGQRNALILGPVIATAESGIFAFSILDDPVHAFDDFRVDKLSSTLAEIGKNQSLILTTHDARFVEYLRVHATLAFAVLATSRDSNGQVKLTATEDPSAELIKFGRKLASDLRKAPAPDGRGEVTALLRMALDEAFERVALRHFARLTSVAAKQAREDFEGAMLTRDRKDALRVFLADSPPQLALLTAAWQLLAVPSKRWSDAVHDPAAIPDADQLDADFDVAEAAIDMLRTIHW